MDCASKICQPFPHPTDTPPPAITKIVAEALLRRGESVVVVDEMNEYYDVRLKKANIDRLMKMWPDKVGCVGLPP